MITILSQPSDESIVAAYTPILYSVRVSDDAANIAPILQVNVLVNNVAYKDFKLPHLTKAPGSPGTTNYFFTADIQDVVQDALRSVVPIPSVSMFYLHREPVTAIDVVFSAWYDNGTGLLIQDTINTVASDDVFVVNAYRRAQETAGIEAFYTSVRKLLTRLENSFVASANDLFFVSVISNIGGLIFEITLYDAQGTQLSTGRLNPAGTKARSIVTLGAGLWQLKAFSFIPSDWEGAAPVVFTNNVASYTITALQDVTQEVISETMRVYLTDTVCGQQFMFLNSFGVYEIMSVPDEDRISYSIEGEVFMSPRATPSDAAYLRSAQMRYMSKKGTNILVFVMHESRDRHREYYRDFLASPEVYLIQGNNLTPVIISAGAFDIKRNHALTIEVTWSNSEVSQRR